MLVFGSGNSDALRAAAIVSNDPIVGAPTDTRNATNYSVQLITTAGLAGSWKIEVSNSVAVSPPETLSPNTDAAEWADITADFSPVIPASTGSQNDLVTMDGNPYRHIRITFTPSNGNTFVLADNARAYAFQVGKSVT